MFADLLDAEGETRQFDDEWVLAESPTLCTNFFFKIVFQTVESNALNFLTCSVH